MLSKKLLRGAYANKAIIANKDWPRGLVQASFHIFFAFHKTGGRRWTRNSVRSEGSFLSSCDSEWNCAIHV